MVVERWVDQQPDRNTSPLAGEAGRGGPLNAHSPKPFASDRPFFIPLVGELPVAASVREGSSIFAGDGSAMNDSLTMSFDPDLEIILAAFETNDDIGKILRMHLVVEGQIERLITSSSRAKVGDRANFGSKVNLLRAMGVPEKICASCSALNDLRNQFAHPRSADIKFMDRFLESVEAFFPKLRESHGSFANRKAGVTHEFSFSEATQGQRIVVAAGFLSGVLGGLPKMYEFSRPRRLASVAGFDL